MDKINTSPSVQIGKRGVDMRGMSAGFGGRVRRGAGGVRKVGVGCGEGGMFFVMRRGRAGFGGLVRRGVSGVKRVGVGCGEGRMFFVMRRGRADFGGRVRQGVSGARRVGVGRGEGSRGPARGRECEREAENESLRKSKIAIVIFLNVC